jgi:hypothetical protein
MPGHLAVASWAQHGVALHLNSQLLMPPSFFYSQAYAWGPRADIYHPTLLFIFPTSVARRKHSDLVVYKALQKERQGCERQIGFLTLNGDQTGHQERMSPGGARIRQQLSHI